MVVVRQMFLILYHSQLFVIYTAIWEPSFMQLTKIIRSAIGFVALIYFAVS